MSVKVINHFAVPYDEDRDTFVHDDADDWVENPSGSLTVSGAAGDKIAQYAAGGWSHVTHETA